MWRHSLHHIHDRCEKCQIFTHLSCGEICHEEKSEVSPHDRFVSPQVSPVAPVANIRYGSFPLFGVNYYDNDGDYSLGGDDYNGSDDDDDDDDDGDDDGG